jgi:AcrR family transcriptional regulator
MELVHKVQLTAERLFSRFGVKSVTMDDVAKEISISKKTLYKCFRDKESLVMCTIEAHMQETEQAISDIIVVEENPIYQLYKITQYIISNQRRFSPSMMYDLKKYHPNSFQIFEKHRSSHIVNHIKQNIELGRNTGHYRNDFDAQVIAHSFSMLSFSVFESLELNNLEIPQNDLVIEIIRYHLRGISTSEGLKIVDEIDWTNKPQKN